MKGLSGSIALGIVLVMQAPANTPDPSEGMAPWRVTPFPISTPRPEPTREVYNIADPALRKLKLDAKQISWLVTIVENPYWSARLRYLWVSPYQSTTPIVVFYTQPWHAEPFST